MQELEHKVVEIIDKLQGLAQPAVQTAIDSTRISALMYMIVGAICAGIFAFALKYTLKNVKAANDAPYDTGLPFGIAALIFGIATFGFGVAACANLLNPDNWLAVVRPDLYLAQLLLRKVM